MRKLAVLVALPVVGALVGVAPAGAQPTPDVTQFCDAAVKVDGALEKVFSAKKPSSKVKQQADQALSQAESAAPADIAATVQTAVASLRNGIQAGASPEKLFSDQTLQQSGQAIDEYRYNSCGYQQVDVTGIEYEFQGLPKTLPAGTVAMKFTNTGAELHELALFRLKGKQSAKEVAGMHEEEFEKKVMGETEAAQRETSYLFAQLKPGRYGAVCHFRVGSTSEQAAERAKGKHHWQQGMIATFTVT